MKKKFESGKRGSILQKVLIPMLVLFLMLFLTVFGVVWKLICDNVITESKDRLNEISENLNDLLLIESVSDDGCLDQDAFVSLFEFWGFGYVTIYDVDYITLYQLEPENKQILYKCIVRSPRLEGKNGITGNVYGRDARQPYHAVPEELDVWEGRTEFVNTIYENEFVHEITALSCISDAQGNRYMLSVEDAYDDAMTKILKQFGSMAGVLVGLYLILCAVLYLTLHKTVVRPARTVSEAMRGFLLDEEKPHTRLDEKRKDEFGEIGRSFNQMADHIENYIANLKVMNEREEQAKAELNISARIQKGLLPNDTAEFPGCEISAMMTPALDVGGDLYDYLQIDDDRLMVMIADVSGKGLAAAVFMTATLMLCHQFAKIRPEPSFILESANNVLAERNPALLFVTAFVGVYTRSTGEFVYANAGHNTPYVYRPGRGPEQLTEAAGTVLGLFGDETYSEATITLAPGDAVYLYTDGVNEAVNRDKAFYGNERLEQCLTDYRPSMKEDIVRHVYGSVQAFVDGADQSDDITMLAMKVRREDRLELQPDCREFERIKTLILSSTVPEDLKRPLCLAVEEIFVNIVSYAFADGKTKQPLILFTLLVSDCVEVRLEDNGKPYDPREQVITADEYDPDTQIGGLGKLIAFTIADDVRYEYRKKRNVLTMIRYPEIRS